MELVIWRSFKRVPRRDCCPRKRGNGNARKRGEGREKERERVSSASLRVHREKSVSHGNLQDETRWNILDSMVHRNGFYPARLLLLSYQSFRVSTTTPLSLHDCPSPPRILRPLPRPRFSPPPSPRSDLNSSTSFKSIAF